MKTDYYWATNKPSDARIEICDPASGAKHWVRQSELPRRLSLRAVAKAFTFGYHNPDAIPVISEITDLKTNERTHFRHSGGNGKFSWDITPPTDWQ